ncbi:MULTISPECIES: magnesium/cobalt transporter CorA [Rhodomicrobium]|uniref:magnesium/cobalt transporter CorA n=1 Tax=Rhodomicrobium TaxID=1068 RepID=UPI000B4B85CB|nr:MULTISPECIES: magnesium/cobalt transporter CorA [Rhodomicrobium]
MITAYVRNNGTLTPVAVEKGRPLPADAIWIDLYGPTKEEESLAEEALGVELPTREEMREIEISSRLYQENGALFMTVTVMTQVEGDNPEAEPITFVLIGQRLATIRYANPMPFRVFASQCQRQAELGLSGETILVGLLDAIIDRLADVLERVQHDMNQVSRKIFSREKTDFEEVIRTIGHAEGLTSRSRESLVSIGRVLSFLSRPNEVKPNKALARALKTLSRDVLSLSDHSSYLANNITFLLNAVLGMSNIEQTDIIKIFSVMAVIFLPPTLIASIYGMNFQYMPEIGWSFGYPVSIIMMILAGVLPYLYFKRRGWL